MLRPAVRDSAHRAGCLAQILRPDISRHFPWARPARRRSSSAWNQIGPELKCSRTERQSAELPIEPSGNDLSALRTWLSPATRKASRLSDLRSDGRSSPRVRRAGGRPKRSIVASPTPLKLSAIVSLGSAIRFPSKFGISSLWSKEVGYCVGPKKFAENKLIIA